jgi:hypothetical protein
MKKIILFFLLFFSLSFYGQSDFTLTIKGIDASKPIKFKKEALKNAVIEFKDNKLIMFNIIGFKIKIPGVQSEQINGNRIDERIYNKIFRIVSKGDIIVISDIKTNTFKEEKGPYPDPMFPIVIEIY